MLEEIPYEEILATRKEVMYPDKDLEFVKLPDDNIGLHMGYLEQGKLIGIVSLFLKDRVLQFRKLAVKDEYQGKGYGSKILQWVVDYANDMKLDRVWCNARKDKTSFYKKFGFTETGNSFTRNGFDYVIMEKIIIPVQ